MSHKSGKTLVTFRIRKLNQIHSGHVEITECDVIEKEEEVKNL